MAVEQSAEATAASSSSSTKVVAATAAAAEQHQQPEKTDHHCLLEQTCSPVDHQQLQTTAVVDAQEDADGEDMLAEEDHERGPAEADEEEMLAEEDRRGIIHLATVPGVMRVPKLRHLMEQFGPVGRIYLAPEDATVTKARKRSGGNRKQRFCEGWIEFIDRRLARRVARSLNGTPVGGKKRNFHRDDMWNMRYLPRFKWHQLKENEVYNRQVRKARLEQKVSQARRETNLYLERVQQSKVVEAMHKRKVKKGQADASGTSSKRPRGRQTPGMDRRARNNDLSDQVLDSLFF